MKYFLTLVFFCMIGLCMFDTDLFVYSSLLQYFSVTLLSFFSLAVFSLYMFIKKERIGLSKVTIIMFLWIAYIIIHTMVIPHGAYYEMYLQLSYFCFFLSVSESIRLKIIPKNVLMYIFFFWGMIESVICLLQYTTLIDSRNKYFEITGSFENPNITAMFIVMCIPFGIFHIARKYKYWGIIPSAILFIALLLLECRTAYLGLSAIVVVFLTGNKKTKNIIGKLSLKSKIISSVLILASVLFAGNYLYMHKKDSADGRIFIWKISTRMIASKPISGYGYGLFEKNYNLFQSGYFKLGSGNNMEKANAKNVNMAYNEYIEQCVNGGIAGLFFYLLILVFSIWIAIKQKDQEAVAVVSVIILMSCFNFIIQAIPVWLIFLVYLTSLPAQEKAVISSRKLPSGVLLVCFALGTGLLLNQVKLFNAQCTLKQALTLSKEKKTGQSIQLLKQQIDNAGASEAYLRNYGKALIFDKEYNDAILVLEEASRYTSNPDVYYSLAYCHIQNRQYQQAEDALYTVAYMIPSNLRSRYQLMLMYNTLNQKEKARQMANEIVSIQPKVTTKESIFYKEAARKILSINDMVICTHFLFSLRHKKIIV